MADEDLGTISYTVDAKTKPLLDAEKKINASLNQVERGFISTAAAAGKFDTKLTKVAASVNKISSVAKTGAVSVTAMVVALGAIVSKAASAARELSVMAELSGVTVERFQELAFGARTVGISTEKLGDIFKDTQDKIGDFINTGGGELKDYFENIAPLVGQTAEEFKGLSGPEALIKFQKGLDAANLSASEQIFYLESLANDAALLAPLLRDNAKGFEDSAKRAKELNLVLSQSEVSELTEINRQFGELFSTIGTVAQKIVADFAPTIIAALRAVTGFIQSTGVAVENFFDKFQDAENIDNVKTLEDRLRDLVAKRDRLNKSGATDGIGRSANGARLELESLNKQIDDVRNRLDSLGAGTELEIKSGAGQDEIQPLKPDKNNPISIFDTEQGRLSGGGDDSVSQMNAGLQDGLGISAQMAAQIEELDAKFQNMGTTIGDTLVGSALTFGDTIGSAFASAIANGDTLNDTFKNIASTIAQQVLGQLISIGVQYGINAALKTGADKAMAASGVAATATQATAATSAGAEVAAANAPAAAATATWSFGGAALAATAALAGTYALSKSLSGGRLNGGAVSPNSAYQVTENGKPEMLTVGGKNILMTGSQGGMVTSNKDLTSGGSGGTTVIINNNASGAEATSTTSNVDGKEVINIVVADINSRGKIHKAMTNTTTANNKT